MIQEIQIENFIGFEKINYLNPSSINLIIGKNDSGKTALLKMLYAVSKSLVEIERSDKIPNLKQKVSDKIITTFFPRKGGLGSLVTKGSEKPLQVSMTFSGKQTLNVSFSFSKDAIKEVGSSTTETKEFIPNFNALFIPAKEVLTAFRAIPFTRENFDYEEFDDTYFDLIKSLRIPVSKNKVSEQFIEVNKNLEDLFEGEVSQTLDDKSNPFMFKKGNAQYTMTLTAEGIKKVGILTTLIKNKELTTNTILFFDEPETALHPEAQRQFAEILSLLSKISGVQIFIATHSYFMVNQFTNIAKREKETINCISIEKERNKKNVEVAIYDLKDGLPKNSIIDEVKAMFLEEMKLELGL